MSVHTLISRRIALSSIFGAALPILGTVSVCAQSDEPNSNETFDWKETASLEHEDRKRRLRKLSQKRYLATPKFYDYLVSSKMLPQFGIDVPVLRVVYEDKVFFETDGAAVLSSSNGIIKAIAQNLRKDVPDVALFVAGHADSRASNSYNYFLSVRRAQAVVAALQTEGVGATNMWSIGFSENVPLRPNNSEENMAINRRVEFLFAARAEAIAKVLADPITFCSDDGFNTSADYCPVKIEATEYQVAIPARETIEKAEIDEIPGKAIFDEPQVESQIEEHQQEAKASEPMEKAEIQPNSRIYIDLKESKVKVGAPKL